MSKKKVIMQGGIPIHQDAGRIQFPIGKDGKVSICGKKKNLSLTNDIDRYKQ